MLNLFKKFKKKTDRKEPVTEKKQPTNSKNEKHILAVVEKTGWSREETVKAMQTAKEKINISYADYNRLECWNLTEEQQQEEYEKLVARREKRKLEKKQCIELAMEKKGWTYEEAKAHVEETRKAIGINYRDYRRYYFFDIPKEEQAERLSEIIASRQARKSRHGDERSRFYATIMEQTGWTLEELQEKIKKSLEICGATFKDYYAFRFWEIDEEEQKTYFTQKMSNRISKAYDTDPLHRDVLLNKELSCYWFADFLRRPWCINRTTSYEEFKNVFAGENRLVYKPLDGNGGLGIQIMDIDEASMETVYEKLVKLPRGVVEAYVILHPEISRIAPNSVNTLRIVTVSPDVPNEKTGERDVNIAYAALRIGSGSSLVDNFTDGGLVVGVNLATGEIETDGVTIDGTTFTEHPDTNVSFRGIKLPYFKESLELVEEAGKKIGGYLGWDIAITKSGPVLIEVNIMPGNRILQMPYVADRKGKRDVMERFL